MEVLVALAVVSVALLGVAGIQLRALQLGQSSLLRTQAIGLANDLAERMEANKAQSASATPDSTYVVAETSTVPNLPPACAAACTAGELAALDVYQWQTRVSALLPQSSWAVRKTASGNPASYEITLRWVDSRGDKALGTQTSQAVSSYVSTRTVYQP